ncbi:MAG: hypothetical protein QNJ45_20010 [Ardenticatenaceae bacterium]|nr:hypothetical protein [Ardenticatenaceae bacterium]
MLRKISPALSIGVCSLLFVVQCAQQKPDPNLTTQEIRPTKEIITPQLLEENDMPEEIIMCTLLGCSDELEISLLREIEEDFIVTVGRSNEPEIVVHCFPLGEREYALYGNHDDFNLERPEDLAEIRNLSPAVDYCGSTTTGEALFSYLIDGYLEQVIVICDEQLLETVSINSSGCSGRFGQDISLVGYTPEEVTISVYWADNELTVQSKPTYKTFYPNGPECDPGCRRASVRVLMPPTR